MKSQEGEAHNQPVDVPYCDLARNRPATYLHCSGSGFVNANFDFRNSKTLKHENPEI